MITVEAVKTKEEIQHVEELLRKHGGELYGDLWRIGVNLSLRISDLLSLTFDDIQDGHLSIKEGKTGKKRTIRVNRTAQALIDKRKASHSNHTYLFEVETNRAKGKAISRETVARKFKEIGEIVGVKLGTHSMRKSRGWAMYSDGQPIEKIAMVLNHATPAVTMRYLGITGEEVLQTYDEYEL